MKTERTELEKLEERISYLLSGLDAAIDDFFKNDCSGETEETENIHEKLNIAWDYMDNALDNIKCLTKGVTKIEKRTESARSVPYIDREIYKELLQKVTPESLQAANKAAVFFREKLDDEEGLKLSKECQAAFIAVMLYEYGKAAGKRKPEAGLADPE